MKLDKKILEIIVCPVCKGDLQKRKNNLVCKKCGRKYPIVDGIPYLLPEDLLEILELR